MSWVIKPYLQYKSVDSFVDDLFIFPEADAQSQDVNWRHLFNGFEASAWLRTTWKPVFILLGFYVALVTLGQAIMSTRQKIFPRTLVFYWNVFLAVFSIAGFWYVLPVALFSPEAGMFTVGLKASVCSNASWYSNGVSGFFVFLFIISKTFELIDTVWLVLGKRPVIFLHWYHHITVLLFCWHAYSKAISTGEWFALVNYGVHSIMYSYYAATQHSKAGKLLVKPFAPYITIVQTSQMAFGLLIILSNMYFASFDETCYSSPTNNLLGLIMYASYFVLFAQIFVNRFLFPSKGKDSIPASKVPKKDRNKKKRS